MKKLRTLHIKNHMGIKEACIEIRSPITIISGPTASGKTSLVKGCDLLRTLVTESARSMTAGDAIPVRPCKWLTSDATWIEATFEQHDRVYRYGFSATSKTIGAEWLFEQIGDARRETLIFTRQAQTISANRRVRGAAQIAQRTRENTLFLSALDLFNEPTGNAGVEWFRNLMIDSPDRPYPLRISHPNDQRPQPHLATTIHSILTGVPEYREQWLQLLKRLTPDIHDLKWYAIPGSRGRFQPRIAIGYCHASRSAPKHIACDLELEASLGTQRLFHSAVLLMEAKRKKGCLVIDTIDRDGTPNPLAQGCAIAAELDQVQIIGTCTTPLFDGIPGITIASAWGGMQGDASGKQKKAPCE